MKQLLLFLCLFVTQAFADETIPFKVVNNLYISIPVTIQGPSDSITMDCWLDTAATQLWLGRGLFERLGLKWDETLKHPSAYTNLSIGSIYNEKQATYGWANVLSDNTCLVGMDTFFDEHIVFDFRSKKIHISNDPETYWFSNWNACLETLKLETMSGDWYKQNWLACGDTVTTMENELKLWRTGKLVLKRGRIVRK